MDLNIGHNMDLNMGLNMGLNMRLNMGHHMDLNMGLNQLQSLRRGWGDRKKERGAAVETRRPADRPARKSRSEQVVICDLFMSRTDPVSCFAKK